MAWVEQYPFSNAEFEDNDKTQPWVPNGWTLTTDDSLWVYAACDEFDGGGAEAFEGGWGNEWAQSPPAVGWIHLTADRSDLSGLSLADEAACIVTANAIKAVANLHFGDTDYHVSGDARTISSADATDLASLLTLTNELFTDCDAHANDTVPTWHRYVGYGYDRPLDTGTATDLETAQARLSAVLVAFGRHLWWRGLTYRWTEFNVLTTTPATDPTLAYLSIADTFDEADTGTAETAEDFEEGWTSSYLSAPVQSALGTNEDRLTELSPSPATFSHGEEYDSFEQGWPEWRHKAEISETWDNQDISTESAARSVANAIKVSMNAHFPSTSIHKIADTATIASPDATDLASLITLVNEEYTDFRTHALDASLTWHLYATDNMDVPETSSHPATDLTSAQAVLGALLIAYPRHLWWKGTDHRWTEFSDLDLTDIDATSALFYLLAEFDSGTPEQVEDFEEEWSDNENRITAFVVPTNLTMASFYGSATAETFDAKRSYSSISTTPGTASSTLEHNRDMGFYFENAGTFSATYSLQVRRPSSATWITYEEFTGVVAFEVPPGYVESRIMCVAYTSGTMTATVHWERMDVY